MSNNTSAVLAQMDDLMAELGLLDQTPVPVAAVPSSTTTTTTTTTSTGNNSPPLMFKDPMVSSGPGLVAKNNMSTGPGLLSFGPGASLGAQNNNGGMSTGPGLTTIGVSARPANNSPPAPQQYSPSLQPANSNSQYYNPQPQPIMPHLTDGINTLAPIQLAAQTPEGRMIKATGPPCAACGDMIIGVTTNALGKSYHPEHFVCAYCKLPFRNNFIEHENKLYCEDDYLELFSPRCHSCQKAIEDTCINAVGNKYHPDCFVCSGCGDKLRGKPYKEEDGEVYCNSCKMARQKRLAANSQICAKCKLPITGEYMLLQGQPVHSEHYRCEECGCEFKSGKTCHEYEGRLYCYEDYQKQIRNTCGECGKPIVGRSVTALGKVWHPEHFKCTTCQVPFAGSAFREHGGKPYCESHYHQYFGRMCFKCTKPVVDKGVEVFGKIYHREHFTCTGCESVLGKEIMDWDGKPLCFKCYDALPKEVKKRIKQKKEGDKKAEKERDRINKKEAKEKLKEKKAADKEAKKAAA